MTMSVRFPELRVQDPPGNVAGELKYGTRRRHVRHFRAAEPAAKTNDVGEALLQNVEHLAPLAAAQQAANHALHNLPVSLLQKRRDFFTWLYDGADFEPHAFVTAAPRCRAPGGCAPSARAATGWAECP